MYFQNFPVIYYKGKDVTNLLRRVGVRTKAKTNMVMFETYDVKEGETPEMIADKLAHQIQIKYPGRAIRIEVSEDGENGCDNTYNKAVN